ncbi:MAG: toll/interleukin-1 receptor domain-containing protein [Rubrivivax sp.]|nr:toll/interleukin-1 receptor domain-containing protein [Rubrivivax sp.]
MNETGPRVYVSYKWGGEGERVVDAIDAVMQAEGIPFVRDKRDLGYKGRISEFMQEIGRGSCVVVVICDDYLKSPNTMYELVAMARNGDVHQRIFPVVLSSADIYDPQRRLGYVKYWEDKKQGLGESVRSMKDLSNLQGITEDLNNYDSIRDHVSRMTSLLKDMNTLTPDMHRGANFAQLVSSLRERLDQIGWAEHAGDARAETGADDGADAAPEDGTSFEPSETSQALAEALLAMMDEAQAEGLMVFVEGEEAPIDLVLITLGEDGALQCELASNSQLPPDLQLAASVRRELVTTYDFAAPEEPGGSYLYLTEPADDFIVQDMSARIVDALINLYGIDEAALQWRGLPD